MPKKKKISKLLKRTIEDNIDKCFLDLAFMEVKLPKDFDVDQLKKKEELKHIAILTRQMQAMKDERKALKEEKEKPSKKYTLEHIYHFPFNKDLNMVPFPPHVEIPKYEKFHENVNPQGYVR